MKKFQHGDGGTSQVVVVMGIFPGLPITYMLGKKKAHEYMICVLSFYSFSIFLVIFLGCNNYSKKLHQQTLLIVTRFDTNKSIMLRQPFQSMTKIIDAYISIRFNHLLHVPTNPFHLPTPEDRQFDDSRLGE